MHPLRLDPHMCPRRQRCTSAFVYLSTGQRHQSLRGGAVGVGSDLSDTAPHRVAVPLAEGGPDTEQNLAPIHAACHREEDSGGGEEGEVVTVELLPQPHGFESFVTIKEHLGPRDPPALHRHDMSCGNLDRRPALPGSPGYANEHRHLVARIE
jgi:hypothetical protein